MFGSFLPSGIWHYQAAPAPAGMRRPGLLLDRDGTLVVERNYLRRPEDVKIVPEIAAIIRQVKANGGGVAVTTNQSGIARGLLDLEAFFSVEAEITRQLAQEGAGVDLTVACPFHAGYTSGYSSEHAYWRKPGPGMIDFAVQSLALDPRRSWMIGDKCSDVAAARAAGLAGAIFLRDVHPDEEAEALACGGTEFLVQAVSGKDVFDCFCLL